jgi:hypothetical protein
MSGSHLSKGINYADLSVNQGTDWLAEMDISNEDGSPADLRGYILRGTFKHSYDTTDVAGNFTISIISPLNGNTFVQLNSEDTANVKAGRYVYDIVMLDASNNATRIVEGILTIRPRVSQ